MPAYLSGVVAAKITTVKMKLRFFLESICCICVCYVFSSDINSTELEARNPLTPLRGGYAGYQNLREVYRSTNHETVSKSNCCGSSGLGGKTRGLQLYQA